MGTSEMKNSGKGVGHVITNVGLIWFDGVSQVPTKLYDETWSDILVNDFKKHSIKVDSCGRGESISLSYFSGGSEVCIDLVNNTSDVEDEHFAVDLAGIVLAQSIRDDRNYVVDYYDECALSSRSGKSLSEKEYIDKYVYSDMYDWVQDHGATIGQWVLKEGAKDSDKFVWWQKREIVKQLCAKLNAKGLRDSDFYSRSGDFDYNPDEGFGKTLMWIPYENLLKMLTCDISKASTLIESYNIWGQAKLLRFKPYIVEDDEEHENPSLVIRRDRFIHMFRGYYFQASGTIDGIGSHGIGAYRMDSFTKISYSAKLLQNSIMTSMLWWAGLIDVGFQFDNFREMFNNEVGVIDDFLARSMSYWNLKVSHPWADIQQYITWSVGNIDIAKRKIYQIISERDKAIYAYMAMGESSIQVELSGNRLFTLTLPDFNTGNIYNLSDEEELYDYECEVETYERNNYVETLMNMSLKLCGLNMSFMGWWPLVGGLGKMRSINSPDVITMKSLNDVYKQEPDKF